MAVLLICCIGAYSLNRSYFDVIIMFIAGILGFSSASSTTRWGPGCWVASGRHVRNESETYSDAVGRESDAPFTTPISMLLVGLILLAIGWPVISEFKGKEKKLAAVQAFRQSE